MGTTLRPVVSRDIEDGNHPNYKQTQDGQLQRSPHGFPLCNYCGGQSHKRQNCPVKLHDRANGNKRIYHPDRDKGTSIQDKIKKQEQPKTASIITSPLEQHMAKLWQQNPWTPQTAAVNYQTQTPLSAQDNLLFQQEQNQLGPIGTNMQSQRGQTGPNMQNFQHHSSATLGIQNQHTQPTPCPYPTCHAVLADFNQVQVHMNQFHTLPKLAGGPGAEQ